MSLCHSLHAWGFIIPAFRLNFVWKVYPFPSRMSVRSRQMNRQTDAKRSCFTSNFRNTLFREYLPPLIQFHHEICCWLYHTRYPILLHPQSADPLIDELDISYMILELVSPATISNLKYRIHINRFSYGPWNPNQICTTWKISVTYWVVWRQYLIAFMYAQMLNAFSVEGKLENVPSNGVGAWNIITTQIHLES